MRGSVRKLPSGNYGIRYYTPDGRRRSQTIGPSRREAERALTARLRELDTGSWREPSAETLAEYGLRWLAQRDPARGGAGRSRLAASTFAEYRRALERQVLPRLGGRALASLRTADVDELVAELEREGKAAGTVRNTVTPLRALLADAVRQGLLASNPAARADLPPAQDFRGQELAPEHVEAIRAALLELASATYDPLRGEPDRFFCHAFDVAIGTGLRLGELRALRWRDVDRERRLVRVERAYSRRELKRPKSEAGVRSVPLFPSVEAAFAELAARALERGRYAPDELVFATVRGTPLHESNLNRRVWRPALERAAALLARRAHEARAAGEATRADELEASADELERARYRWHDLRHTCVSRLVAAGADVKLVQAVAGHASPVITLKRYSHLLDGRIAEAAARFDPGATRAMYGPRAGHASPLATTESGD